jgi:uncharacterized membrane protein YcaP (DUF421 family)
MPSEQRDPTTCSLAMDPSVFVDGWRPIARVGLVGLLAYVALVLMLRVSGKRTLSKLNAFDLVVTVALGSTLASVLTSRSLSLATGVAALGLLIFLQFVVSWTSVRWPRLGFAIRSEPTVLLRRGEPIRPALRRERVTEGELIAAIRSAGGRQLQDAEAVFLESDGSLTALLAS